MLFPLFQPSEMKPQKVACIIAKNGTLLRRSKRKLLFIAATAISKLMSAYHIEGA